MMQAKSGWQARNVLTEQADRGCLDMSKVRHKPYYSSRDLYHLFLTSDSVHKRKQ